MGFIETRRTAQGNSFRRVELFRFVAGVPGFSRRAVTYLPRSPSWKTEAVVEMEGTTGRSGFIFEWGNVIYCLIKRIFEL
jgi:hypothetical protein